MRKRRRRIKKYRFFMYIALFFLICLTMQEGYSLIRQNLYLGGNTSIKKTQTNTSCSGNVTYDISSWSNNGLNYYKIMFNITNNGNKDYNNWEVYFDIPDDTEIIAASSTKTEISNTQIKASSVYYNSQIKVGDSIAFEIQIATSVNGYEPSRLSLNNCFNNYDTENDVGNLKVEFDLVSINDDNTYQYDVLVYNIGTDTINNWTFSIERTSGISLINYWNVNYIMKENCIEFSNQSYNGLISPGGSVSFGLIIKTDNNSYSPKIYE